MIDHVRLFSSIKKHIKTAVLRAFPEAALKLFSMRSRRKIEAQARSLGLDAIARKIARATGSVVAAGPFAGLRLNYELFPNHASPKFLGTYEQELHSVIERAICLQPKYVLNVGCAEGFYAVGLAIRLNDAQIFAADADSKGPFRYYQKCRPKRRIRTGASGGTGETRRSSQIS